MNGEEGEHSCSALTRVPKGKEQYQETLEVKRILGPIPASEPKAGGIKARCRGRELRGVGEQVWVSVGRCGRGDYSTSILVS